MMDVTGKKLLILGGTPQHCKLVTAAKEMGVYTIVTDYLENSPAKKIADKAYMINIRDVDEIIRMCKREKVDGVISGYIDPCQKPYNEICKRLDMPCYGTKEQFFKMTDKHAFKKMCQQNGVDVIPEYSVKEAENVISTCPVFVKPVDSRGSRGQAVCYTKEELHDAIEFARSESSNGDILIEKYMKGAHEFQVTYFFVNGEPYLIRTTDSYCGSEENHLEKVVACAVSPSIYTDLYLKNAHEKVIKMFKNLGFKNGPIFMQGFVDGDKFRFFDPGLRFPGVDYENIYKKVYNVDLMKAMVLIALTGECSGMELPLDGVKLDGKRAAVLFPTVKAGIVTKIDGVQSAMQDEQVVSYLPRCEIGDEIMWSYNVNQRFAEVDILGENTEDLKKNIKRVQKNIEVFDENGQNMIFEEFDTECIK